MIDNKLLSEDNKLQCNYCGKTIFPFSVYLDMEREGMIVYCNQDCQTNYINKWIEDAVDSYNRH